MDLNKTDEQMKVFQEGGLTDDGMTVDPVSGNEIPPGSNAADVRDDVNAKLSENEYVVPADVVRYFGVGYFEKLREKAKKALAEMDADGRIGGEPIEESEDDFPFSDDELMAMDEEPVGMATGGLVGGFADGFAQEMTEPSVQTKVYVNDQGEQRTIMFVDDQPIQQIPSGFKEATDGKTTDPKKANKEANRPDPEGGVGTDGTDSGFGNEAGTATGGFADAMAGAMDSALGVGQNSNNGKSGLSGIGQAIGGAIAGAFGGGGSGNSGGASSGTDGNAGSSGANGGMGGYAARGMLVDKRVKQKRETQARG